MEKSIIRIENAALKFKNFSMKPASFEIPEGYIIGLQGDNGAGKTTLLRMMLGCYEKMKGHIYIDGMDVVKNKNAIKKMVGVISQERTFFMKEDASGNERLYAPFYPDWDSGEYYRMLKHFRLSAKQRLGTFSTGEMIRYQFAFVAACRPKLLFLDEPEANLDPVFRDDFLKILQEFIAEYEISILFATHLEEDLLKVADYIIDVEDGVYGMRIAEGERNGSEDIDKIGV